MVVGVLTSLVHPLQGFPKHGKGCRGADSMGLLWGDPERVRMGPGLCSPTSGPVSGLPGTPMGAPRTHCWELTLVRVLLICKWDLGLDGPRAGPQALRCLALGGVLEIPPHL